MKGGVTILSTRVGLILVCGIIVLLTACMNYRETATMSFTADLMVLSAVLIFVAASVLYRQETQ